MVGVALSIVFSFFFLDKSIALYCDSHFNDTRQLFWLMTKVGNGTPYFIALPILFVYFRWLKGERILANKMLFILASIAASGAINSILKFVFGRYRPYKMISETLYGFTFFSFDSAATSFPSGHANLISALMLSLYFVFPRLKYIWLSVALLVMVSRVVVGVHFLSDIVFGSYVAILTTLYIRHLFQKQQMLPSDA